MRLGIAVLRIVIGVLFMGHGLQKLKGWFGGPGPEGTAQMFEGLGLRPGRRHASAAGMAETAGGACLAAGFLTPVAGATLTSVMGTAIHKVHGRNGPWNTSKGYEYNLVLIAALFGIADTGPGRLSADAALGIERSGPAVAVAQLAAGLAGSAAAIAIAERAEAPDPQPEAAPAPVPEAAPARVEEREPYRPRFAQRGKPATAEPEQAEAEREASR
ncbi:MAG: DoxX family protein [Solirubrobacteraceae bacterium]